MKLAKRLIFSLLSIALFSCGAKEASFRSFTGDFKAVYNGEVAGVQYEASDDYQKYCIETNDAKEIIAKVSDGESVFILLAAGDCSHCQRLRPYMCEFLASSPIETHLIYTDALANSREKVIPISEELTSAFPALPSIQPAFPYGYLLYSKDKMAPFSFSGHYSSLAALSSFLYEKFDLAPIRRFASLDSFSAFLDGENTLGYIYHSSSSPFFDAERERIKKEGHTIGLLKNSEYEEGYYAYENGGLTKKATEAAYSFFEQK